MSKDKIIKAAVDNGLKIDPGSIELNESGLDSLVAYVIDQNNLSWVFRIPRRADVIESSVKESKILALVRQFLPVQIPDWRIHTTDLIAYPKLTGEPAATIDAEAKQYVWKMNPESLPETFTDSLAKFLAALHQVDHKLAAASGIRVLQLETVKAELAKKMDATKKVLKVHPLLWQKWQEWLKDDDCWPRLLALVHGDLHPGHILIDQNEKVTGILDWTEAEVTDPAIDFAAFHGIFGASALSRLLESYRKYGGITWPRMQEHITNLWTASPVNFVAYAQKINDYSYMDIAQVLLDASQP